MFNACPFLTNIQKKKKKWKSPKKVTHGGKIGLRLKVSKVITVPIGRNHYRVMFLMIMNP